MLRLIVLLAVALFGFWFGKKTPEPKPTPYNPNVEFALSEHKSFVIVLYAYNQENFCKKALRSIFEQDYTNYRVILIDDASVDETAKIAQDFIVDMAQDEKVIFIKNESHLGLPASLYRIIDNCLDKEIVISLEAKDWFTSPHVLTKLNLAYQNPDVWVAKGWGIEYPTYKMSPFGPTACYAALYKEIHLKDLFQRGQFIHYPKLFEKAIQGLAKGRVRTLHEPLEFLNIATPNSLSEPVAISNYLPLASFPDSQKNKKADVIITSKDHPLRLYASLESIQRYVHGYEKISVYYEVSDKAFFTAYERVKDAFPMVQFFQDKVANALLTSSDYILWGTDDLIIKDGIDLKLCIEQMEKTKAYGLFFRLGANIAFRPTSQPLSFGLFAWDLEMGEGDWVMPQPAALYKKETLQQIKSLDLAWEMPAHPIGLYFERSKAVGVGGDGKTSLAQFNQGLKIDIDSFYKIENSSPCLERVSTK